MFDTSTVVSNVVNTAMASLTLKTCIEDGAYAVAKAVRLRDGFYPTPRIPGGRYKVAHNESLMRERLPTSFKTRDTDGKLLPRLRPSQLSCFYYACEEVDGGCHKARSEPLRALANRMIWPVCIEKCSTT